MTPTTKLDGAMMKNNLIQRIDAAIERITSGHGAMRVPAEDTDPDLVLAECKRAIELLSASKPAAPQVAPSNEDAALIERLQLLASGDGVLIKSAFALTTIGRAIQRLAASPTAPASPSGEDAAEQADEVVTDADMFWPEHDGEQIYHSLDDAVTAVFEDSGAAAGDTFTFTCAARLPKVTVRIIEVTENGFEWEEIAARAKDSK